MADVLPLFGRDEHPERPIVDPDADLVLVEEGLRRFKQVVFGIEDPEPSIKGRSVVDFKTGRISFIIEAAD